MQPQSSAPRDGALAPPALLIYLLGPPRAAWHGQPLTIPRRQARALLYRLAAEPQPIPRDHLCFLFWPDTDETTARHNLSRLLTILHQALPDPHLLHAHEDQIELDPQCTWSDTRAFDECWVNWCQHGDPAYLHVAADLYRGPFLAGFDLPDSAEFDAWVRQAQEFWTRRYLQTLAALSETLTTSGEYAGAIDVIRRYLATDELAEAMHRRLIELYALAGDRSAALQQYETCVTILERELGVDPTPATRAAYHTILQGNLPDAALPPRPAGTTRPAVEVPLVGRAAEMEMLAAAWAQARAGRGRVVLIGGEPGVGKSRLMLEFAGRMRGQARVLSGGGYPETASAPYQPLIDALQPHVQMARFEFDVYPAWLTLLAQLFPELRPRHLDLPMPAVSEPGWARTRLFEALLTLMAQLAAGVSPVVMCLDDLHWADSGTLDWLGYLGRRIHGLPLLVVGTYRTEEARPLGELRGGLARQHVLHELVLQGLNEPAIDELLQHLAEEISSCAEQAWLHAGLAEALQQAGDVNAALAHARQAQALAEASGRVVDRAVVQGVLARLVSVGSIR